MLRIYPYQANFLNELISSIGNMASAGIQAGAQSAEANKQRKWNEKMYNLSVENNRQDATTAFEREQQLMSQNVENQLKYDQQSIGAKMQGALEAGLNPVMALNGGGLGTSGVGGVATPQAEAASPMPYQQPKYDLSGAFDNLANMELKKAQANEANAKAEELRGETEPSKVSMQSIKQGIDESKQRVTTLMEQAGFFKNASLKEAAQTSFLGSQTTWQELCNTVSRNTQKEQEETIRWGLYNLKKQYWLNVEALRKAKVESNMIGQYLNAMIGNFNKQASLFVSQAQLTDEQKHGTELDNKYFNMVMPDMHEQLLWRNENERTVMYRFEESLEAQLRGQNMQLAGDIIHGLAGAGATLLYGKALLSAKGMSTTTTNAKNVNGRWVPQSQTIRNKGMGLR